MKLPVTITINKTRRKKKDEEEKEKGTIGKTAPQPTPHKRLEG